MLGAVTPSCVRTLLFHFSFFIHTLILFPNPALNEFAGSVRVRPPSLWLLCVSYKCEACCRVRRQTGNQSNQIATNGWIGFINGKVNDVPHEKRNQKKKKSFRIALRAPSFSISAVLSLKMLTCCTWIMRRLQDAGASRRGGGQPRIQTHPDNQPFLQPSDSDPIRSDPAAAAAAAAARCRPFSPFAVAAAAGSLGRTLNIGRWTNSSILLHNPPSDATSSSCVSISAIAPRKSPFTS
ncbi:hypothetical protein QR685DRAFT_247340 [Neurospora intermedia]|uniref:Uncharacterized protein n=1 Tax=Neurospora intermedia TaxID=5142 RepID=A0ABR3DE96_NEUIN